MKVRNIKISVGDITLTATLNVSNTSDLIWSALPINALANRWGDEIYFKTNITAEEDDSMEIVDAGDLGYWPPGQAICIFFGPTPASIGNEIRPASPVNIVGKIKCNPSVLKIVQSNELILVERD